MKIDRRCGTPRCTNEAIGFVGKFGETRTTGSPVTTAPGQRISVQYCVEHEAGAKDFLDLL
jgi:hypothetical protein